MKIESFERDLYTLQPGWKLSGWEDIEEIFAFWEQQRKSDAGRQVLLVLDDECQAGYTADHAILSHGLNRLPAGLLSEKEREAYESDLTLTPAQSAYVLKVNMVEHISQASLAGIKEQLIAIDDVENMLLDNYEDTNQIFESPLKVVSFPATDPSFAIAARPNGYFSRDLTPGENYLLAERIRTISGMEIIGLGAAYAAYIRPDPLSADEATAVVREVRGMYCGMNDELAEEWARAATGKRWFLLSYSCG